MENITQHIALLNSLKKEKSEKELENFLKKFRPQMEEISLNLVEHLTPIFEEKISHMLQIQENIINETTAAKLLEKSPPTQEQLLANVIVPSLDLMVKQAVIKALLRVMLKLNPDLSFPDISDAETDNESI